MKLPPQITAFLNKYRSWLLLGAGLLLLVIVGFIFRALTPPPAEILNAPSYAPVTPKAGFVPPQNVNLGQLAPVTLPSTAPAFKLTLSDLKNHQQIAAALKFTAPPQTIQNIQIYRNSGFVLTVDSQNHQIAYTYDDSNLVPGRGNFQPASDLYNQAVITIKGLGVYDLPVNFQLLGTEYLKLDEAYMIPATEAEASVAQITLTPIVDNKPVYLQQPLIVATYNRANVLVKLDVTYPFTAVTADEVTTLLTLDQIRRLNPSAFFPLYIAPTNLQEAWAVPTGLGSIAPQELALAHFLDVEKNMLQPIFTFKGANTNTQNYIYATLAFPTKTGL